jgi:hypothetical protein
VIGEGVEVASVWEIVDEVERDQWTVVPLVGVGPARFGMNHGEVLAAVADGMDCFVGEGRWPGRVRSAMFRRRAGRGSSPAMSVYYNETGALACVAVGARSGPQVNLDGLRLVGRVPSELEDQFADYLEQRGYDLRYSQHADPGSESLGLVLRVQRVGDVVLSRPVFVAQDWAVSVLSEPAVAGPC